MATLTLTSSRSAQTPRGLVKSALKLADIWRQRRALSRLDGHRLTDIGLTQGQALRETRRPVWDLPR